MTRESIGIEVKGLTRKVSDQLVPEISLGSERVLTRGIYRLSTVWQIVRARTTIGRVARSKTLSDFPVPRVPHHSPFTAANAATHLGRTRRHRGESPAPGILVDECITTSCAIVVQQRDSHERARSQVAAGLRPMERRILVRVRGQHVGGERHVQLREMGIWFPGSSSSSSPTTATVSRDAIRQRE